MQTKGFTIVELLVVISIIALLAAFVSTSLIGARTKGADQAVKSTFRQVFVQAEIYKNQNGGFGSGLGAETDVSDCNSGFFADPQMSELKTSILSNSMPGATLVCNTSANGQLWAMSVSPMRSNIPWCADNSAHYKSAVAASGICP
jgi:prepilin-type N-terminal cleavage/methylation domain-containing protein